jgi:hypothetical protein
VVLSSVLRERGNVFRAIGCCPIVADLPEELLWKSGPIISFLFPAYVPLVSAFIFACFNLTPRILSLLAPKQRSHELKA